MSFTFQYPNLTVVNSVANYEHIDSFILQNATDGILPVDIAALEKSLKSLGQTFMEAIITNGNNFAFITQFDIFLSNQSSLDDCAYPIKSRDLGLFDINLHQKTRFKTSWNELIIQNGKYQILITGSLYGTHGSSSCQLFLGSSFPFAFPDDIFTCYINKNKVSIKSQQRHLIDYKKSSANLLAGFIFHRFSLLGLEAVHPLYYANAVPEGKKPRLSHIASKILCYYADNSCTSNDVIDLLHLLLQTNIYIILFKDNNQPTKCRDLRFLLKTEASKQTKNIIKKLIKMEQITKTTSPVTISTLDYENESSDEKLRDLVNDGLSSNIKKKSKEVVNNYTSSNKQN